MKKKSLSIVMIGIMLCLSLAGCGSTAVEETDSSETVTSETTGTEETTEDVTEETTEDDAAAAETEESSIYGAMEGVTLEWNGPSYKPYRYMDENGDYIGYDFDVIAAVAEILGFEYNYTEAEFAGTLAAIGTGTVDFMGTVGVTDERQETMDFTRAYYVPKTAVLVMEDSGIDSYSDLIGKTVCGVLGSIFAKNGEQITDVNFYTVNSDAMLGVEDVLAGRADAVISESVELAGYQAENEGTKVVVLNGDPDIDFDMLVSSYHYAFTKGSPYVELFNEALDILADNGTLAEIQEKWLGADNVTDWSTFDAYEPVE